MDQPSPEPSSDTTTQFQRTPLGPSAPDELPITNFLPDGNVVPRLRAAAGPRYLPQRLHARGGLGEVWHAHDAELDRPVALKRIRAQYRSHPEAERRFLLEAEVTGRLQ